MRKLLMTAGICTALGWAVLPAFAQSPKEQSPKETNYEQDAFPSTGHRPTVADQIIFERSVREARERESRIESRHWRGISLQRPTIASPSVFESRLVVPWERHAAYVYPSEVWIH
jgi:hypothetical protein